MSNSMSEALVGAGVVDLDGGLALQMAERSEPEQVASNQPEPSNPAASAEAFIKKTREFGRQEGQGVNARPAFFMMLPQAAKTGAINEDDAESLNDVYTKGQASAKGVAWVKQGSAPQQVSKIKTMIKVGQLANVDGCGLIYRVAEKIMERKADTDHPLKKSPVDCYLAAARMQINQPDIDLTDEQVDQALETNAPAEKVEVDILGDILAKCDALATSEANPPTEDTQQVLEDLMQTLANRIKELGGTSKQRRQLEKAEQAAEKARAKAAKAAEQVVALAGGAAFYSSRG